MLNDVFVFSAIVGGAALLIQLAMSLFGFDDLFEGADGGVDVGADVDVDAEGAGSDSSGFWLFEMISMRSLAAAVTTFGVAGKICLTSGASNTVAVVVSLVAAYAAMYAIYWTFKQLFKLETSGNIDIRNSIGLPAQVYVSIPGGRGGSGKVQMKLQNRVVEYQAVTEESEGLKPGDQVTVTDLVSSDTVVVARSPEPVEA